MRNERYKPTGVAGLLSRIGDDRRGNTLAIAAAAFVPLAGFVGGGLDLSRLYLTKTRLQHACDAGALAGRKAMGSGVWTQQSNMPNTVATQFFDGNFEAGAYGSQKLQRTYTENAGKVSGKAQADVPMTLMKIFQKPTETLVVTCDADMRLPNTDVMFVLDTTQSMSNRQPGDSVSKMDALKTAVKCFYEIVARIDTRATCTTGVPSGGTGNQVQIRFGFVPYATNVNVGRLLPTAWFADSWQYQTRQAITTKTESWKQRGNPTTRTEPAKMRVEQRFCNQSAASTQNSNSDSYSADRKVRTNTDVKYYTDGTYRSGECYGTVVTTTTIYDQEITETFLRWRYAQLPVEIGEMKNGSAWRASFEWPTGDQGADKTIWWNGCIEERRTVKRLNYDPIPDGSGDNKAWDLDIDLTPTRAEARSLWGMALPDVIYTRRADYNWTRDAVEDTADFRNRSFYYCPTEAKLLQRWPDPNNAAQPSFDNYVDSLWPNGNTYHDIGLLWGARFLSPTGLFQNKVMLPTGQLSGQNATTEQGGDIERNLIFMTDGEACTDTRNYEAYGIGWFDRRQTDNVTMNNGCTMTGAVTDQINLRTDALCTAIKNKNITLWVVAFGDINTETRNRLSRCATPGRYFLATNAAGLQQTFKSIADQISQLRLTS